MVRETSLYYDQMSSTVSQALRIEWEKKIIVAESKRLKNPSVMDILGARDVHIDPEPTDSGPTRSDVDWLILSLSIEERQ